MTETSKTTEALPSPVADNDPEGSMLREAAVAADSDGNKDEATTSESTTEPHATETPSLQETTKPGVEGDNPSANGQNDENFWNEWFGHFRELAKENPDLNKTGSELQKAVVAQLQSHDPHVREFLAKSPRGIRYAVQLAQLEKSAKKAATLEKENGQLRTALKERDKKLAPSGGVASALPQNKNFDQMNFEEQGNYLKRMAQEEDGLI